MASRKELSGRAEVISGRPDWAKESQAFITHSEGTGCHTHPHIPLRETPPTPHHFLIPSPRRHLESAAKDPF